MRDAGGSLVAAARLQAEPRGATARQGTALLPPGTFRAVLAVDARLGPVLEFTVGDTIRAPICLTAPR